jgi:hypothetical protein
MVDGVLLLIAELLELLTGFGDEPFHELALADLFALQQALYRSARRLLLADGLVGTVQLAGRRRPFGIRGLADDLKWCPSRASSGPTLTARRPDGRSPEFLDLGRLLRISFPSFLTHAIRRILFWLARIAGLPSRGGRTAQRRRGARP